MCIRDRLNEGLFEGVTLGYCAINFPYHDAAVRLVLADEPVTETRTYPAGTYVVRTGQMQGRLAAHMLEPETNDNVIYWNTMDAWLPLARLQAVQSGEDDAPQQGFQGRQAGPPLVPITKLMTPRGLPLRMVN